MPRHCLLPESRLSVSEEILKNSKTLFDFHVSESQARVTIIHLLLQKDCLRRQQAYFFQIVATLSSIRAWLKELQEECVKQKKLWLMAKLHCHSCNCIALPPAHKPAEVEPLHYYLRLIENLFLFTFRNIQVQLNKDYA